MEAGHTDAEQRIRPFRIVQDLRSKGSAHRKNSDYVQSLQRAGLDKLPLVEASTKVFAGSVQAIEWLRNGRLENVALKPQDCRLHRPKRDLVNRLVILLLAWIPRQLADELRRSK